MLSLTSSILHRHCANFAELSYIVVQHIKNDTVYFLRDLAGIGGSILHVIGISYSAELDALASLEALNIPVEVCAFSEVSRRLSRIAQQLPRPSVILDVGGYAAPVIARVDLARNISFVVEDTNNGLWQYQSIAVHSPVIEVASIENKQIENAYVGRRIVDAVMRVFADGNQPHPADDYVVVGFGGIGRAVCSALALNGIKADVVEVDERKLAIAKALGHRVAKSVAEFSAARVIIGCTGSPSVFCDHLTGMYRSPYLFSGSSKRIEFEDVLLQARLRPGVLPNSQYDEVSKSTIVNNGEPINLRYGSLNEAISDFMYANIASAILEGIEKKSATIYSLSDQRQRSICSAWWQHYR